MFSVKLLSNLQSVGETNAHLQFTPKYRRAVFQDDEIRISCELLLKSIAQKLGVTLVGLGFGPDHVHLFVSGWKNYSITEMAQRFKGCTSRALRKAHKNKIQKWLWGNHFWSGGYFYRTVGAVNNQTMIKYIKESQGKHWAKQPVHEAQTTLLSYA